MLLSTSLGTPDASFLANGMTAVYYPDGLTAQNVLPKMANDDITIAGGLHKEIKGPSG